MGGDEFSEEDSSSMCSCGQEQCYKTLKIKKRIGFCYVQSAISDCGQSVAGAFVSATLFFKIFADCPFFYLGFGF